MADDEILNERLGRYVLERSVARGGMAEIFLARQEGPAGFVRQLLIKRVLPELANQQKFVELFLDEARLASQLSHPNIAAIHDFGEVDGSYFMALELVAGPSLRDLGKAAFGAGLRLPYPVTARIGAAVAEGLAYAHSLCGPDGTPLGIVHRDVSPANILVSVDGVPKIVDFGIAKAENRTHKTQSGELKGKIAYMAPEQVQAKEVDGRADVYALGVVLYQMVSGKRPYKADSDFELMQKICAGQAAELRSFDPDVPQALERIIARAMAADLNARYQSARELSEELDRYAMEQGAPITSFEIAEQVRAIQEANGEPLNRLIELINTARAELSSPGITLPMRQAPAEPALTVPERASTPKPAPTRAESPAPAATAPTAASVSPAAGQPASTDPTGPLPEVEPAAAPGLMAAVRPEETSATEPALPVSAPTEPSTSAPPTNGGRRVLTLIAPFALLLLAGLWWLSSGHSRVGAPDAGELRGATLSPSRSPSKTAAPPQPRPANPPPAQDSLVETETRADAPAIDAETVKADKRKSKPWRRPRAGGARLGDTRTSAAETGDDDEPHGESPDEPRPVRTVVTSPPPLPPPLPPLGSVGGSDPVVEEPEPPAEPEGEPRLSDDDGDGDEAVARGRLVLRSQPKAEVYIKGQLLGFTPLDIEIPAGAQQLTLKTAEGVSRRVELKIRANKVLYHEEDLR